jgi:hypothetical protein
LLRTTCDDQLFNLIFMFSYDFQQSIIIYVYVKFNLNYYTFYGREKHIKEWDSYKMQVVLGKVGDSY